MSDEGGADIASEEGGVVIHVLSERGVDVKIGGDDEGQEITSDEGEPTCAKNLNGYNNSLIILT